MDESWNDCHEETPHVHLYAQGLTMPPLGTAVNIAGGR